MHCQCVKSARNTHTLSVTGSDGRVLVTLLDVGGSADSRGGWKDLYGEAHGIIFVVDSSDRQRIREVKEVLADLIYAFTLRSLVQP